MVVLIVVVVVILVIVGLVQFSKKQKRMEQQIAAVPDFRPAVRYTQPDFATTVLLDPQSAQFAVARMDTGVALYGFDQLVAVDVERDGSAIQKTNRGSQIAGAAVGGVLLGPVGLLLGGLSGSKRSEEAVKRLALKLYTNDLHAPMTEIIFFQSGSGVKANALPVREAARQLDEWYGRFQTVLRAQQQAKPVEHVPSP
jgi:hypothetical protein